MRAGYGRAAALMVGAATLAGAALAIFAGLQAGWVHAVAALLLGLAVAGLLRPLGSPRLRLVIRAAAGVSALAALAPWLALPIVPGLPAPTGPFPVGSHVFRWVDPARDEPATADPADRRNVIAQLWYPAGPTPHRPGASYIDGIGALPPSVAGMPRMLLAQAGRIRTHAAIDAPVAEPGRRWPLVLFSPGAGAPRAFYTGLCVELASRGFAVAALDHPYDSAVTRLADGRLVTDARVFARVARDPTRAMAFMATSQEQRADDMRFVLDALGREPQGARLALGRVVAAGHSFGGASALQVAMRDPRVLAGVNLDGAIYGNPGAGPHRAAALSVVESDGTLTRHEGRYSDGLTRLAAALGRPVPVTRIDGASHVSFTDAPAFVAWPVRAMLPKLFGRRRAAEVQRLAVDRIVAASRSAGIAPP